MAQKHIFRQKHGKYLQSMNLQKEAITYMFLNKITTWTHTIGLFLVFYNLLRNNYLIL